MIRPLLASHGLEIGMSENGFELREIERSSGKKTLVAVVSFSLALRHVSGERDGPESTTVVLPYTGAQTTGSARSYAIKEWIKTRFLASSGDMHDEQDLRAQSEFMGEVLSKKDAKPLYEALQREMRTYVSERDPAGLQQWALDSRQQLVSLPADWRAELRTEYEKEWKTLKAGENLDKGSGHEI